MTLPSSPRRNLPSGNLSLNRQQLIWILSVSMFFCVFLGWNNKLEMEGFNDKRGTYSKAFQVNGKHNLTRSVKQISLIGERNSGTKWMWA